MILVCIFFMQLLIVLQYLFDLSRNREQDVGRTYG